MTARVVARLTDPDIVVSVEAAILGVGFEKLRVDEKGEVNEVKVYHTVTLPDIQHRRPPLDFPQPIKPLRLHDSSPNRKINFRVQLQIILHTLRNLIFRHIAIFLENLFSKIRVQPIYMAIQQVLTVV